MNKNTVRLGIAFFSLVGLSVLSSTFYTVAEDQQALVVRLGAPTGAVSEPGLKVKIPMLDTVIYYDRRLQILTPRSEQVILGDQKRIEVETYTHFRIVNPLRFYQSVRTVDQAGTQLSQLVSSSLRRELGQVMLPALLSKERPKIVERIQKEVIEKARPLGIEVTEVRFHRADLPLETSQAIYDRMKSEIVNVRLFCRKPSGRATSHAVKRTRKPTRFLRQRLEKIQSFINSIALYKRTGPH